MNSNSLVSLPEVGGRLPGYAYPTSVTRIDQITIWMQLLGDTKHLVVYAPSDQSLPVKFEGITQEVGDSHQLGIFPMTITNGRALWSILPNLKPTPIGLKTSIGMGDRLGFATPGHVLALRNILTREPSSKIFPIFAQQSVRENLRTGRTPEQVLNDATWGAFQAGWTGPVGADADHLKSTTDIDVCSSAGYSQYTIDPGSFVDGAADTLDTTSLIGKYQTLPWVELESSPQELLQRYSDRAHDLGECKISISREELHRSAVKYGRAIAHVVEMYRHLVNKGMPFDLEVSVDETDTPTKGVEHFYIASELRRLGVRWVSLAPRFILRFQKGVDYTGDLQELANNIAEHATIARCLGPYKLSMHSGSDKFSVYPFIAKETRGLVHLKTAGTSYLEALRVLSEVHPALFREIISFARECYENDRISYAVSANLSNMALSSALSNEKLPMLLDQFDARQVLHVTFGSVLDRYGPEIKAALLANEDAYYHALEKHFFRHIEPLLAYSR